MSILIETKNVESIKVRLSLTLRGDTARILLELRAKGVIRSFADAVNQGIRLLYEKTIEQDIRYAHLKALQGDSKNEQFVWE